MIRLIIAAATILILNESLHAAEVGHYAEPALHGDRVIFVSEGDLWSATIPPESAAEAPIIAWRLTTSEGAESRPQISPDGSQIAFAAQYDGNVDVYVMPIDGGAPTRLTFHPDPDVPLCFNADGRSVLFRSRRANPHGRTELFRVSTAGGMPIRYAFGECSMAALGSTGSRIAFTRWSNENWNWKGYRGGTAPEIWTGDLNTNQFHQLTNDPANDQFPMWLLGRVFYLSDRSGATNIYSDSDLGGDLKQHTNFIADTNNDHAAVEGYDIRWPSGDAARRGLRIVFCQAGGLALLDVQSNEVRRLDVRLASDRLAARQRFAEPMETATEFALSPDGEKLLLGSRGEIVSMSVDEKPVTLVQISRSSNAREWGASYLGEKHIVMITDLTGEQQIAAAPADGSDLPSLVTQDREDWLMPPSSSPDGNWIAFGDKTLRLHVLHMPTLVRKQADQSEAGEITDYRFSPDSNWLAYVKPMPNQYHAIFFYSLKTQRSFQLSDGMSDDTEPRWDPAGKYLYFLSRRHLDPMLSEIDFEHVFIGTTGMYAATLAAATPPPIKAAADRVGFDLEKWASKPEKDEQEKKADAAEPDDAQPAAPQPVAGEAIVIDTDGIPSRIFELPIDAGNYRQLEAAHGAICYLSEPSRGLLYDDFGKGGFGPADRTLHRYDFVKEEAVTLAEKIAAYEISGDGSTIAYPTESGFKIIAAAGKDDAKEVDLSEAHLRINIREEWRQIFEEAWRLQRDFYWAPNYGGVDWAAIKTKYAALLPRVGTRVELNDLIGRMIGELGTSHTYIWGGQERDEPENVAVGLLGADIDFDGRGFRITRIIPVQSWAGTGSSPLGEPFLAVKAGSYIFSVNGVPLTPGANIYDLLQDQAGKVVRLSIADDAAGANQRTINVKTIASERDLRYLDWVERNRLAVEKASDGAIGYLHVPDMGGEGLVVFSRLFYPQYNKKAMIVDIRDNGGGFVSQMILSRLAREVWAFMQPRHGLVSRYPEKTLHGPMAVLIDQFAGSDGDIFPESFRLNNLGPLIGTRTWGGVVGIRGDKPFVDFGVSTQPEYAWWEPKRGWNLENEGVSPDIEVHITPEDRIAGRDPQLQAAIDWLLKKMKDEPMELPPPPPWPVRGN